MPSQDQVRYDASLNELARLVQQRNDQFLRLEMLATLPLSISPRSGHVAEFDTEAAQTIIDSIRHMNDAIQQCMAGVNRLAQESGLPVVQWLPMPCDGDKPDERSM